MWAVWHRPKGVTAKLRAAKRRKRDAAERASKAKVRQRDVVCRFPLCRCLRTGRPPTWEVSHSEHKGMGGDPTGDRSTPDKMVLLCSIRHRISRFSIDRCGIRWRPLTDAGADGPIAWDYRLAGEEWYELAREAHAGELIEPDRAHRQLLQTLAFP